MTETIQSVTLVVSVAMVGYGLWLITPAAMWIGIGTLLVVATMLKRLTGRNNRCF